ncbi:Glutamate--tRNA ligase [Candidatus Cyrtobacter comes]|uniref:Glutamate--tRNA ligase n=1 Tax=Candidatus Cyrtobacter comes TaxID=675776 RepID=A0ABU5L900_9RICK|nr:glutamate--tRNA ligase [Candidatus Cyrtobacter comes]MDZ5762601.1 Glutamate--tRNA ligase [Candidatus Cyrtobacter comes]
MNNPIRTRFAPSPTGRLHIGGVRTALFNWLFSHRHNGKFFLRIEDTDRERSDPQLVHQITQNLEWLGINWDDEIIFQSQRLDLYKQKVDYLVKNGFAYRCYLSQEEINNMKLESPHAKIKSIWRDKDEIIKGKDHVIRLKCDLEGIIEFHDEIRGLISVNSTELEDLIILKSDGFPTYSLAAAVDDADMKISHVIRGDDHITNTFYQIIIYRALGCKIPSFTHIPLIHNKMGEKMSKRKGATDTNEYKEKGYLPEALANYLLRLGWGKDDIEIITMDEATKIFDLADLGRSPARFDIDKLNFLNHHYINIKSDEELVYFLSNSLNIQDKEKILRIERAIKEIKKRSHTLNELQEYANLLISDEIILDEKCQDIVISGLNKEFFKNLYNVLQREENWQLDSIKTTCEALIAQSNFSKNSIMKQLRSVIIGTFKSQGLYDFIYALGKEEVLRRICAL